MLSLSPSKAHAKVVKSPPRAAGLLGEASLAGVILRGGDESTVSDHVPSTSVSLQCHTEYYAVVVQQNTAFCFLSIDHRVLKYFRRGSSVELLNESSLP